ncbi:hypothetical protein C1645_746908 [Glomus cerebriforme]|uniref:Uncharacterized protein n=1 Tax=Glomus cerebriforme TaxID=658196 RepID=A0A397TQH1_9GLOM|nr:hypothetical protein C1645_746908 [Glomus cerebriforme]
MFISPHNFLASFAFTLCTYLITTSCLQIHTRSPNKYYLLVNKSKFLFDNNNKYMRNI